jgi:uncharacterized protein
VFLSVKSSMARTDSSSSAISSKRDELGFFFLLALGATWLLQLPVVLAQRRILPGAVGYYMLPAAIGGFSPLVAALLAAHRENGRKGIRQLFRSLRPIGVGWPWYPGALLLFGAIYVAGVAACQLFGIADSVPWLYLPEMPQHIVAMVLVPITEEPGWRGYALPRLQVRFGTVRASLILGVLWAAWHTMMFLYPGPSVFGFAVAVLNIVAGSVVFSWLYNRTHGGLGIAMLAHAGAHLNNPAHAQNVLPLGVYTIALALVGCALIVFDRNAWQTGQR